MAVIDSGVHAAHPHVGQVAGGIAFDLAGTLHSDYVDRLSHGTAVAAAIHEKAPDAELYAVKVFDRSLATSVTALVRAVEWAIDADVQLINLSLGTSRPAHEPALSDVVLKAAARHVVIVSARRDDQQPEAIWFPGSLDGVLAVEVDWTLPRNTYRVDDRDGAATIMASGFPREIPGVPRERNLHGVSFAVANATGFAAQALETISPERSLPALLSALRVRARAAGP